ncbi:MAG: MFS transporter [Caldilineaceae bacterium]
MIAFYLGAFRRFHRDIRMYFVAAGLLGFSYFGIVTVLLNLYLLRLGYGAKFIGLVNGSTALAFATSSVGAGLLGTRWGYRRAVMLGLGLVGLSAGLLPIGELFDGMTRNALIVLIRFTGGLGFAFYMVNANPYLVAAASVEERNAVFAMQVALPPFVGFFGSIVAGLLPGLFAASLHLTTDHPAPYRYPLIIAGVIMLPAVLAVMTTGDIPPIRRRRNVDGVANPAPYAIVALLSLTALLRMTGEGAARSFFNVYLDDGLGISTANIGLLTAIGQILAGPTALIAPALMLRRDKTTLVALATLGIAASLLIMGLFPHWLAVGVGFMGVLGMLSITRAVTNVVYMEIVPADWRGNVSGITSMAMGTGFSSMALGGGFLIPYIGYQGVFLIGACTVTTSALCFWLYFRTPRGEYAVVT